MPKTTLGGKKVLRLPVSKNNTRRTLISLNNLILSEAKSLKPTLLLTKQKVRRQLQVNTSTKRTSNIIIKSKKISRYPITVSKLFSHLFSFSEKDQGYNQGGADRPEYGNNRNREVGYGGGDQYAGKRRNNDRTGGGDRKQYDGDRKPYSKEGGYQKREGGYGGGDRSARQQRPRREEIDPNSNYKQFYERDPNFFKEIIP